MVQSNASYAIKLRELMHFFCQITSTVCENTTVTTLKAKQYLFSLHGYIQIDIHAARCK